MSKSLSLIIEAKHREPDDWSKQAAFMGDAIGKLVEQQLMRSPELDDEGHSMIIGLIEALELPAGPLLIPREGLPLIMSEEEGRELDRSLQIG